MSKTTNRLSAAARLAARKFHEATGWIKHLDPAPKPNARNDSSENPYAAALNTVGTLFVTRLRNLAKAGDSKAIKDLVSYCHEMVEAIEEIAERLPESLIRLAARRADWPVMISRHETSAKPVAAYLDKIKLGVECVINADGTHVAKYSLRTPINRFVWNKLKRLPHSIAMFSDVPEIAGIHLESLPKLTKATAKIWADKVLLPYISVIHEDFSKVPEFSGILARPGVRTRGQQRREIRKDVIRSLQSLAPAA
jgi:hypothetical protein